jgi:hypothetical protein
MRVSIMTAAGGRLDASRPAEADRDGAVLVENHRHGAAAGGVGQHPRELGGPFLDVDVVDRDVPPLIVCPGGLRVRSGVLAEDRDHARDCTRSLG